MPCLPKQPSSRSNEDDGNLGLVLKVLELPEEGSDKQEGSATKSRSSSAS
jgi:hypothetical protein